MAVFQELIVLLLQFFLVDMYTFTHEKPVTLLEWKGRCTTNSLALNDCNWCRCDSRYKYKCDARSCGLVDKFGHFNDAIRDINVGMEGKGSWRSAALACEPGVQYRRTGLLCVCTEDGAWPNPVCRDIFRVLHSIEQTGDSEAHGQDCVPLKLYLVGCNVCFCPSSGQLNPEMCTRKECSKDDPVMKAEEEAQEDNPLESLKENEEIYAECNPGSQYKMGCKTCECLSNNRLYCGNCTFSQEKNIKSFCSRLEPDQTFNVGCNLCYCDENGFAYCSTKKCLLHQSKISTRASNKPVAKSNAPFDEANCLPGRSYKRGCNTCFCDIRNGQKIFSCTLKKCGRSVNAQELIHVDCVKGTSYELNCLICQCDDVDNVKTQLCWVNPECTSKKAVREPRSQDLDSLHGYCEPFHEYRQGCNTCRCMADGKTVRCTSYTCASNQEPVSAELVPVAQPGAACPSGLSYRIHCNYCFCLSNGNAICTTQDCRDKGTA